MTQKKREYVRTICDKKFQDDMYVHLTIYDIPVNLLREFCERVVKRYYRNGVSEAIKDLMFKALVDFYYGDSNENGALTVQDTEPFQDEQNTNWTAELRNRSVTSDCYLSTVEDSQE